LDWAVGEWIDAIGGRLVAGGRETRIAGVSTDSRTIGPGQLFVALIGPNFDAHNFTREAAEKGAAAVMLSKPEAAEGLPPGVAVIQVEDTLDGLDRLASAYRLKFDLPVAALSGSSGKTSTKEMLRLIIEPLGGLATGGNLNNRIGVPLTVFRLEPTHKMAVFELAMNVPGELGVLTDIVKPNIVALTNVGTAHVGNFESREALRRAKAELIVHAPDARAIFNADDFGAMWIAKEYCPDKEIVRFGIQEMAEYMATDIQVVEPLGYQFKILTPEDEEFPVTMRVFGRHNIHNALCATAIARALGIGMEDIVRGLEAFRAAPMRSEILELGRITIVADCYNANPDSVAAAIEALDEYAGKRRRVFLFADMLELGNDSEMLHREVGQQVASHNVQLFATMGEQAAWACWEAARMGVRAGHFANRDAAARALADELRPGDLLLVKGSRLMKLEDVIEKLKERL
jgi:UDP-N-acetylmuramoyl-tripeptide--D-alanyl-D-alanine ligase